MRWLWLIRAPAAAAAVFLGLAGSAHAEITVMEASYGGGVLVLRGETSQPNQRVVLDGRFRERTDRNKRFAFRIRYLPRDCTVELRAGRESRVAYVANCEPAGAPLPKSLTPAASAAPANQKSALRIIRQPCETNKECRVLCRDSEFAINAYCPGGQARLEGERAVACEKSASDIVAYCMSAN